MSDKSLKNVRNTIFSVTAMLAAAIVALPAGAADFKASERLGPFAGLASTSVYNAAHVRTDTSGERYRLNGNFRSNEDFEARPILRVQFDQKTLLPLAPAARATTQTGFKARTDIALDRDRSLIADYRFADDR